MLAGQGREMRVEEREPNLDGFATLPFTGRVAFRQVLAFVRSPRRFERGLDKFVRDSRALQIQRIRDLLGFGEGQVPNRDISIDLGGVSSAI